MADYYPLIARAVAGLEKNTGDARRALYERARSALVAQLRGVNPPLSENDVTRERLALEESIRKVEAEAARKAWVDPTNGATPMRVRAPEFPRWEPPPSSASDNDDALPPTRPGPQPRAEAANGRQATARALRSSNAPAAPAGNGMLGGERHIDPTFDQPQPLEQARPAGARSPKQDRRSLLDAGLKDFRDGVPGAADDNDPMPRVVKGGPRENGSALPASHDFDRIDTRPYDPHAMSDFPAQPMLEQGPDYDDARPLPATARQGGVHHHAMERASRRSFGDIVRIALTLLILAGLAGVIVWQWPNMMALYQSARTPASSPTAVAGDSPPKARSTKVPDRLEQTGGAPARS